MKQIYRKSELLLFGMFWPVLLFGYLSVDLPSATAPVCQPPVSTETDCSVLPGDFDPQNEVQMTSLFGTATCGTDCDGLFLEELEANIEGLNDCGTGRLVRRFGIKDAVGEELARCQQMIRIYPYHDYWIKFPADVKLEDSFQKADTILISEGACDLLAVAWHDEIEICPTSYSSKVSRTYSVINWCEYDGVSPPVIVGRDEDGNGQPGDKDIFVIVKTMNMADPCRDFFRNDQDFHYQHVWYDLDSTPFKSDGTKENVDGTGTVIPDFWREVYPSDMTGMNGSTTVENCQEMTSVGYWQYTQFIELGYASAEWEGHLLIPDYTKKNKPHSLADRISGKYLTETGITSFTQARNNTGFQLYQNAPNPFTGQTMIRFDLTEPSEVILQISDADGKVLELIRGQFVEGPNQVMLHCDDWQESGILYYTLIAGRSIASRKMILKN